MRIASLLMLPVLIGSSVFIYAQSDQQSQRQQYADARELISTKDWQALPAKLAELKDYPLAAYLEYERLLNQPDALTTAAVTDFSVRYADTPLPFRVQRALLDEQAKAEDWNAYLASYRKWPADTARYQCLNWRAQLATGTPAKSVLKDAALLWPTGYSLPNACDPLFKRLIDNELITSAMGYQRYWAAQAERNSKLARYAARFATSPAHKHAIELFEKLRKEPHQALKYDLNDEFGARTSLAVTRLTESVLNRDRENAANFWLQLSTKTKLPDATKASLTHKIAIRLAKNFRPGTRNTLAQLDPDYTYPDVTGWRIRLALADQDWSEAERMITRLPEQERKTDRWRYWQAIVHSYTQPDDDKVFAQLRELAHSRSFYGFLAAELSEQSFDLNNQRPSFDQKALDQLAEQPAFKRMHELLQHEQTFYARSEWNKATADFSNEQKHLAAHLANRWGWHDQSIRGAIAARKWNDMSIRFPIDYQEDFRTQAQRFSIPANWAMAVARQESAYRPTARSHAGARGLMQLMPKTARQTSRRHQIPLKNLHDLYEPATNIQLGSAYLGEMLEDFNGNRIYATAAYNAGPHRVKRWLKDRGDLPLDIWIETIPFDETRNYVQNVLAFAVIYDVLSQRPTRLLSDMESSQLTLAQR